MPSRTDVVIVGAGFCGALTAIHLARAGLRVTLVDRSGRFGPGLAYGAAGPLHLLNTPAGRMSAFPEDPDHFTRWARARDPDVTGGSFLPRRDYAAYLESLLADVADRITCLSSQVTDLAPAAGSFTLSLADGRGLPAARVVLATGNLPPADPPGLPAALRADPRYLRDPWQPHPLALDPHAPVLLLGTGLTALDLLISLADAGHRGELHAASRRGLLPQPHRSPARLAAYVLPDLSAWPASARGQLHAVRAEVRRAAAHGVDWRDVIAALRPHTADLWRRLPLAERSRFLRHVRPYWDSHRHRAAPATHAAIQELRAAGRLHLHAATLLDVHADPTALHATLRLRGGPQRRLSVGALINCTGPAASPAEDPLIARLIARGLARVDPLGLGLDLDLDGALAPNLHVVGAMRRPQTWESTAVLELAVQVAELAARLP